MSTISSGSSGLTWTSDNSSNLAITLTSIVDNTGNTIPSTTLVKGAAKAWVNFNGVSGVVINSSFNVSSITRNSAGNYTINFTTSMPNVYYAVSGSVQSTNSFVGNPLGVYVLNNTSPPTTSNVTIVTAYYNQTPYDYPQTSVVIHSS